MKSVLLVVVILFTTNAFAHTQLQSAFAKALNQSDNDKSLSRATITLEDKSRDAAWSNNRKQVVKIPSSMAVDMPVTVTNATKRDSSPQIDTDSYVTDELRAIE